MGKKTAIITGGNKGIGLDIARVFADSDYEVFIGAREDTQISHKSINFIKTDVRLESAHKNIVNRAMEKTGRLDVYINNAGFSEWRSIKNIDDEFLDNIIATNLKSVFWGCKAALSAMDAGASILNISSIASKRGSKNNSAYCATKFGVNGITQSLAKECGKRNIRINAVCPVIIPTKGLISALEQEESPAEGDVEAFINKFCDEQAALPYLPSGESIGKTCLFLASNGANSITGQSINVDCGVFPQ